MRCTSSSARLERARHRPARLRHDGAGGRHDPAGTEQGRGGVRARPGWPGPTTGCWSARGRGRGGPRRWPPRPRRPPGPGRDGHRAAPSSGRPRGSRRRSTPPGPTRPRAGSSKVVKPVAGGEHGWLERRRVEMGLAVPGRELAAGVEDERRVVDEAVLAQLGHAAGGQPHLAPPGRLAQLFRARPVARLGVRPGIPGQRLGVVAAGPQLRQHQELDAARRGVVHHAERHVHVLARLPWCGQPLGHTNQKISLHVGYLVFPPLVLRCAAHPTKATFAARFPVRECTVTRAAHSTPGGGRRVRPSPAPP